MHNFGVISDMNIHAAVRQRCGWNPSLIVRTLIKVLDAVLEHFFMGLFISIVALAVWPLTLLVLGAFAIALGIIGLFNGINVLFGEQKYYIKENKKFTALITRRKTFGTRLKDFLRG